MLKLAAILALLTLTDCRVIGGRWVEEQPCPGGNINTERRVIDTLPDRTRTTTIRTNACLER